MVCWAHKYLFVELLHLDLSQLFVDQPQPHLPVLDQLKQLLLGL